MFKKTKIAMATAAMLGSAAVVPVAEAVSVNPDGLGQVLIFPYYNTNGGFQTSFNIRNTKDEYKAIKIRLRESENSNDVLDFNVYMSPFDMFTFTVVPDGTNSPKLVTTDKTCTFPTIPTGGVSLKGNVYAATDNDDAREGYVEVIELGVIDDTLPPGGGAAVAARSATTIAFGLDHGTTGVPADCTVLGTTAPGLANGTWTRGGSVQAVTAAALTYQGTNASPAGFFTPTGGLAGTSILLDVTNGAAFVADPLALVNYAANHTAAVSGNTAAGANVTYLSAGAASTGNGAQYYLPNDAAFFLYPSLASGNVNTSEVFDDTAIASLQATWSTVIDDWGNDDPNAILVNSAQGPESGINPFPVAHALAATSLSNEYFIDATLNGATDWVVTFPMRKHGIFNDFYYDGAASQFVTYGGASVSGVASSGAAISGGAVSDDVTYTSGVFYDREEQQPITGTDFSPVVSGGNLRLEREVNVMSFTNTGVANNAVLGSLFADGFSLEQGFNAGWASLGLLTAANYDLTATNVRWTGWTLDANATASVIGGTATAAATPSYIGVPTMGFAAIRGQVTASDAAKNVGETIPMAIGRTRGTF